MWLMQNDEMIHVDASNYVRDFVYATTCRIISCWHQHSERLRHLAHQRDDSFISARLLDSR